MLPKHTSILSLMFAVVVAGLVGSAGYKGYLALTAKAEAQTKAVEDFQEWKRQYTQLLPLEEQWQKTIPSVTEVKDLYSLHTLLGNVPKSNPDALLVDKISRVTQNSVDLGAQWVCLGSLGAEGVKFQEANFSELMKGLNELKNRPNVKLGAITLVQEKATAVAVVAPVCLMLRDKEGSPQ